MVVRHSIATGPMETTVVDTDLAPSSDRTDSGSTGQKRWLLALLLLSLMLRLWRLEQNGFGTDYYSAGVRSMMTGWHRFFYNAFDPGGFVSVDKPPIALWIQVLSAKVLGFHGLAVLLPQVLEGVAAVWLLFHLVQRRFGSAAGLLAGFLLAITPISVASDRSSNTDSCLVLVLLLAAWALIKAIETGRRAPLVLSMALVGLGFNVKMLAAFVVLPAFALAHWLGARLLWRRLIADWGVASLVLAGVSLSWVVAFDLTPADRRPFAGSTTGNSMIELVVGHNGVGRFVRRARPAPPSTGDPLAATARSAPWTAGATIGPGPGGSRPSYLVRAPIGPLRLADRRLAAQVAWFFPLAVVGLVAGASWARRRWPLDAARSDLLLWSGWVLAYGVVYSYAGGIFHYYYLATLGPPLAALAGVGLATSWEWYRRGGRHAAVLPLALLVTAAWQAYVGFEALGWHLDESRGLISGIAMAAREQAHDWRSWLCFALVGGTVAPALGLVAITVHPATSGRKLAPTLLALGIAALSVSPAAWTLSSVLVPGVLALPSADLSRLVSDDAAGRSTPWKTEHTQRLVAFLKANHRGERFVLSTSSSLLAAPIIVASGEPVMARGGFFGQDPILTPEALAAMVESGQVRFIMVNDVWGLRRRPDVLRAGSAVADWVRANGTVVEPAPWRAEAASGSPRGGGQARPGGMQLYDMRPGAGLAP
jgi:4-amino-4-deoxy-L-arabinose transferase-like glycosyltransferase